jgi:hypothetical protein
MSDTPARYIFFTISTKQEQKPASFARTDQILAAWDQYCALQQCAGTGLPETHASHAFIAIVRGGVRAYLALNDGPHGPPNTQTRRR